MVESTFSGSDDIIDLRDLTDRLEALEALTEAGDATAGDLEELSALATLLEALKGFGGDHQWRGDWYPLLLINEDHFTTYAEGLADDIGAIPKDAPWPLCCIDWDAAAEALKVDYGSVGFDGGSFLYR